MSEINIDFSDAFGPVEDVEEQEVIEPAEETEEVVGDTEQESTEPAESQQSAEDNAKFAAARRKAEKERDDAIAKMKEDHIKEMDEMFRGFNIQNPYTGKMVESRADFEAYINQHAEEQRKEIQEETGISDADIDKLVESHPKYQKAMLAEREAAQAKEAADKARLDSFLDDAVKEIGKLDPDIKSKEDLFGHSSFKDVDALVRRGYSLPDAYEKVNREAIRARERSAWEQQIRNSMNGRSHLDSNAPHGDGGIQVPADIMNEIRMLNPNMSDAEITKWYAKDMKRTKKG